ncbi:unnamed protein product [Rotaria magnacalcarata]
MIVLFTDNATIRHIFKHHIRDLILHNSDEYTTETTLQTYTTDVYVRILYMFGNLKHLTIVPNSVKQSIDQSFIVI